MAKASPKVKSLGRKTCLVAWPGSVFFGLAAPVNRRDPFDEPSRPNKIAVCVGSAPHSYPPDTSVQEVFG